MQIIIGTPSQLFSTIGHDENRTPFVLFEPSNENEAIEHLVCYFNQFHKLLETGVELTESEMDRFSEQFRAKAKEIAMDVIGSCILLDAEKYPQYKNWKFCFLPNQI